MQLKLMELSSSLRLYNCHYVNITNSEIYECIKADEVKELEKITEIKVLPNLFTNSKMPIGNESKQKELREWMTLSNQTLSTFVIQGMRFTSH